MNDLNDLTLILKSRFPILAIETHEEPRAQALLERIANLEQWPLWSWSVTQGLKRFMVSESPMYETKELVSALRSIEASPSMGLYVLLDADPFLQDAVNLRLIKEIALGYNRLARTLVLVGHKIALPADLQRMSASFRCRSPTPIRCANCSARKSSYGSSGRAARSSREIRKRRTCSCST